MVRLSSGIELNPNELTSEDREAIVKALADTNVGLWKPKENEEFFYINWNNNICHTLNHEYSGDEALLSVGNYFKTEEAAEKHLTYLKALQVLRGDTKGYEWDFGEGYKYVYYNGERERLETGFHNVHTYSDVIKFETKEDAQASINAHEKEWRIVLGVEYDE